MCICSVGFVTVDLVLFTECYLGWVTCHFCLHLTVGLPLNGACLLLLF